MSKKIVRMKKKRSQREQRVAAEILTQFMFVNNMDDFKRVYDDIYSQFDLCDCPYTHCPCTPLEYSLLNEEYQRDLMVERYGHCDGLE